MAIARQISLRFGASELVSGEGIRALHRDLLESLSIVHFSSFVS